MNTERFWNTKRVTASGCWEWTRSLRDSSYGQVYFGGKVQKAHRLAWTLTHGEIPAGLFVCHRCDNPKCINPDHLFLGTPGANVADMMRKGRARHVGPASSSARHAKATWPQVVEIRSLFADGASRADLARKFGLSWSAIHSIVIERSWKAVSP